MNRKLVSTALAAAMVCSMGAASATTVSAEEQKTVGILMPTQSSERWINDGANMKKQLEEKRLQGRASVRRRRYGNAGISA